MEVVVNEWLLEYLRPDAEESDRRKAFKFVSIVMQKCYKIVIKGNSPFVNKFRNYSKLSEQYIDSKQLFSMLHKLLFRDSDKTIIVNDSELQTLPEDIAAKTPSDDKYLIELWYSKQDRIVVTTDTKLKDKLKDIPNLKICLLQEFLQEYLA